MILRIQGLDCYVDHRRRSLLLTPKATMCDDARAANTEIVSPYTGKQARCDNRTVVVVVVALLDTPLRKLRKNRKKTRARSSNNTHSSNNTRVFRSDYSARTGRTARGGRGRDGEEEKKKKRALRISRTMLGRIRRSLTARSSLSHAHAPGPRFLLPCLWPFLFREKSHATQQPRTSSCNVAQR